MATEETEKFHATNGRLMGYFGLVVCAAVAVILVREANPHDAVRGVALVALLGVLFWAALLRPRVWVESSDLRMLTMLESVTIPLASIDTALVRRYLLVRSGGQKFLCPAISRSLRKTVRSEIKGQGGARALVPFGGGVMAGPDVDNPATVNYADFVEQRIESLARDDRARLGIEERSEEEYELGSDVRRDRAWPEIAGLVVLAVVFTVTLFL